MKCPLHILHLEDSRMDAELIAFALKNGGIDCAITQVRRESDFETALDKKRFDVILADGSIPSFDGLAALREARKKYPGIPFIFVSGNAWQERIDEYLKAGATEYINKDHLGDIVQAIKQALAFPEECKG